MNEIYISPIDSKRYHMVDEGSDNSCKPCAFIHDDKNCSAQGFQCGSKAIVYVPVIEKAEYKPNTDTSTKPTNPKDSIGIRKAPMSTVSAAVMAEIGVAMLEGAAKYGRHNYREAGVRASVYYDATMRHLMAWWEGEDIDPDSQMSHITKAITSLVVYRDAMIQNMAEDDRPPKSADFYTELNKKAGVILDKYADKNPKHVTENNIERKST